MMPAAMSGTAWIVGGGGGIGAACARHLARSGWRVVVTGRDESKLHEVVSDIQQRGGQASSSVLDVGDDRAVTTFVDRIGECDVLVYSAGTNVAQRWWDDLAVAEFESTVSTNLTGLVRAARSVLPGMRRRRRGTIIALSSWSGWQYMSGAGAAYLASKRAVAAVVESINDQEGPNGVRAANVCPGEVATPIVMTRPVPPTAEEFARMLEPDRIGEIVAFLCGLPTEVCVNEIVITPTDNAFYTKNSAHRGRIEP